MEVAAGALLAAWMAQALAATLLCAWYLRLLGRPQPAPRALPPVLVLVPVRGPLPGLDGFLAGLAAQDYPRWRAVFALESEADPAWPALAGFAAADPARASVVAAGPAEGRGQKVQNLLAALSRLREEAAVVTLDADMRPPPDLLSRLLRPVLAGQGEIATGYRWTLPADRALGSTLAALAEMAIATLPRCARCNLCWGGATALSRAALERLDLPRAWRRAVSDDLALTRAARAAGLRIYAPLEVRPANPVAMTLRDALRFGCRQYRLVRLLAPRAWALAALALLLPAAGGAAALAGAARGSTAAAACLLAAAALGAIRAALRTAIARRVLPPAEAAVAARTLRRGPWLQPLALALHLAAALGGGAGRELRWAGRRYTLGPGGEVLALVAEGQNRPGA
ncbi:glycosyltransferase [Crenalkalicoccus roseus]|uniref:glycosyltransferase n=1 Tax=Crenalkalicoccus roseus TaxID=1485588 RepID=UPI00107FE699|nr:glycosyltransferase family 2 protein [Crenalkalicoccus roseus]